MSTEEKVELVSSSWEEYGLATALAVVELPTSTWYYHNTVCTHLVKREGFLRGKICSSSIGVRKDCSKTSIVWHSACDQGA
jgi:hypothetical protein